MMILHLKMMIVVTVIYYAVAICALLAWFCNLGAMASWYNLKKSSKMIKLGWLM